MSTNIRKANAEDLPILISMGSKLHDVEKSFEPLLKFSSKKAEDHYKLEMQKETSCFLIAEYESVIVGYLYGHLDIIDYFSTNAPEAEVEVVYLKPEARGKGLAKSLVGEFSEWAKAKGAFRIKAGIYEGNSSSKNLFLKSGFRPYHTAYTLDLKN